MRKSTDDRFWAKVAVGDCDECWEWQGGRHTDGYGAFWDGTRTQAHRYAAGCTKGDGNVVMHSCDNPPCCNPAHLRIGTHADNAADRQAKNRSRSAPGEMHGNARLSADQVTAIRSEYAAGGISQQALADRYGVTQAHVSNIVLGKKWRCWS